jgi:LPPG:FO 2-phospho-L-lactate transferase
MILALAGGVGGAKLAHGLYQALPPNQLTVVVNTADDFELWGLHISPDLDTVMYTLAGIANSQTGWGIAGDTWNFLEMLDRYGYDTWFRLGDRDVATHVARTEQLRSGRTLTQVTQALAQELDIHATLLPMCDQQVRTIVDTPVGHLQFQDYFVRRHHSDPVHGITFQGVDAAGATEAVAQAVTEAEMIIFCPSNPLVSIGPILAISPIRSLLQRARVPKIAVSPIVGGKALRGPADQMLAGLGYDTSAYGVATIYRGLVDVFVIDKEDADQRERIEQLGMRVLITDTIMRDESDRRRLAHELLQYELNVV